jgi:acyl transferase domain-containing protein
MAEVLLDSELGRVNAAEVSQPISTAVQIALFLQFQRLGVKPTAVVGHSSGEIAAAYAAGHLSLEDAIVVAHHYGRVASQSRGNGAMAAVGLGANEVAEFMRHGVVIACENSARNTTISGDADAVDETLKAVEKARPDVTARKIHVDVAYHSRK